MTKYCKFDGCKKQPSYNYYRGDKPIFCKTHKKDNMINVKAKLCESCSVQAFFPKGSPRFCAKHKLEGMKGYGRKCVIENCQTHASYPEGSPRFCGKHKLKGMKCRQKKCVIENCQTVPSFPESSPRFCGKHKLEGMKCRKAKCVIENCQTQPSFPKGSPRFCAKHKLEGMKGYGRKCVIENCQTRPKYNLRGLPAKYCYKHKTEKMVNVYNQCQGVDETKLCPFGMTVNSNRKRRCSRCFQQKFPEEAARMKLRNRTKEIQVRDYINSNYSGFIHDKPVYTNHCDCSIRRRIDVRNIYGNTMLAIECDENQHLDYDEKDVQARVNDLYMAFSGKYIYIRMNPDTFKNHEDKRRNPGLKTRLPRLKEEIDKQIKRIEVGENRELVEEIFLFYDGFEY